jgi:hypothetical protein
MATENILCNLLFDKRAGIALADSSKNSRWTLPRQFLIKN